MRRFINFVILIAGTFYLAIIYKSRGFIFLGYAELLLAGMGLIYNLFGLFRIRIFLEAPLGITEVGKEVPVKIRLENYSIFPTGKIWIQLAEEYSLSNRKKRTGFCVTAGGRRRGEQCRTAVLHMQWLSGHVGTTVMRIRKARSFDLFGMLALPVPGKAYRDREEIMVLPPVYQIPIDIGQNARDFTAEQERYLSEGEEKNALELFQIREYQPGDKIRSIHWKLSAKEDELMVKEYQETVSCPVLLFLDMTEQKERKVKAWKKDLKGKEQLLTVLLSLSCSMVQNSCSHFVIWYDEAEKDIKRYRVEKREDTYILLQRLVHPGSRPESFSLEEAYMARYHMRAYAAKLVLNRELQLNCNGERVISYDARRLKESLMEQEIFI